MEINFLIVASQAHGNHRTHDMNYFIKKLLATGLVLLACSFTWTQGVVAATQARSIQDPQMVISGSSKLELLPTSRAVPQPSEGNFATPIFSIITTSANAPITNKQLAVAYNHALNTTVFLTGEVSFKLKAGANLSTLQADLQSVINVSPKLLVPPSVYIFNATSPAQIVNLTNKLKASSAVEWAEAAVILGRVN
jgi:hypothetical protein